MPGNIYITASAAVTGNCIIKNGLTVFEDSTGLPGFLMNAYHYLGLKYSKFYKMDNLCKLGILASEVLLKDSFEEGKYKPEEVGMILFNSSASLDADLKYFESTKDIASPALFVYTLPNIVTGEICIKHKFKGENAFFIFESFDADFMEKYVSNLVNNDILQACICGWVELVSEECLAVLFLVEKDDGRVNENRGPGLTGAMDFTSVNLNKIYQLKNG